jgi:type IV pilus assembly protein PilQ
VTVTRGFALCLICVLVAFMVDTTGSAESPAAPTVHLKSIRSHLHAKGASLVIEATEPAPYVTSRPDPLTVVLDFRGVDTQGLADSLSSAAGGPIARVGVEATDLMGAQSSRVRIALTQPVAHTVRSERNTVIVDFEKALRDAAPNVSPPAARDLPDAMDAIARSDRAITLADQQSASMATLGASSVAAAAAALVKVVGTTAPAANQAATAAVASAPPQAGGQVQPEQLGRPGRVYTGNPVSLDFQGADLRAVLRMFSEISGLNIVIDPAVQGSVDVVLKDVPWDQALDLILRSNKLGYLVDGTIVRIAPLNVLADEEGQRRKLSDEQALAGELRVLTRTLSYARAEELQNLLTRSALSQRGTVQVDPRTNTLIITDLTERLNTATDLINTLDKAQPQVEIEARIVQTSRNFARQLGVQWGFSGRVEPALGNTTNLAFPNSGSLGGRVGPVQGPAGQPTAVNLAVGAATSAVGLALGSVNGAFNLDVALSALEESGNGRILSTPRVSTLNNVEAEVTQGIQIPLQTIANNTVTVTFKDAALTLRVTPQITAADTVIMKITLENATPNFSLAAGPAAIPPIDTQRAITTLLVNDGQTTVIGGIYTSNQQNSTSRTPGLGQIPLLNWLFKRDRVTDDSKELLIFITPRIIRG